MFTAGDCPPTETSYWGGPILPILPPFILCWALQAGGVLGCGSSRPPCDATFAVHVSVLLSFLHFLSAPSQCSRRTETRQKCLCLQFEFSVLGTNPRASCLVTECFAMELHPWPDSHHSDAILESPAVQLWRIKGVLKMKNKIPILRQCNYWHRNSQVIHTKTLRTKKWVEQSWIFIS